jgi:hypothetical protein
MILGSMTDQEWGFYIAKLEIPPAKMSWRSISLPDHSARRPESLHRCFWTFPNLPPLSESTFWFFKKWFEDEVRFRALITSFALVRQSWTGVVRVEFTYRTWFWNLNVSPATWTEI